MYSLCTRQWVHGQGPWSVTDCTGWHGCEKRDPAVRMVHQKKTLINQRDQFVSITTQFSLQMGVDGLKLIRSKGGGQDVLVIPDYFILYAQSFPTREFV